MQVSQMDLINAAIEYGKKGTINKEITQNILKEWRGSKTILDMIEADKYSKVQNTAIDYKTRSYQDESGALIVNDSLSNVKSKTAQYRKSVNQKLNFALSKPFVLSCDNDKYKEAWEDFLNDRMRNVIKRTGKNAINKGIGYMYPWINEKGELEIIDMIPETMYPAWKDIAHTELDAMVRDYSIVDYNNETPTDVRKVEFWDREIVEKFIDYSLGNGNGALSPDIGDAHELDENIEERASIINTHMTKASGEGVSWERVPFVFFKGNDDELPLLNECKSDIDNYDMLKSKGIDSLIDDIDAVLVVEDISPEMGELARARKILQNSRIMTVDKGGSAHFEKVDANIQAIAQQLEIIKKDIQDNTSTVDLTTIQFGNNPSGKAMRTFFESLNEWANGFEAEFRVAMDNLKYFFDKWLSWKGGYGTFEKLQEIKITFTLDRDLMIDETDIINNIMQLKDELSQETRDELNPYVESHEKEQQRRDEEEEKLIEKNQLRLQQLDTTDPDNDPDDPDADPDGTTGPTGSIGTQRRNNNNNADDE